MVEGLGRALKVEVTPLPPPTPAASTKEFDPRISDPNLGEHLGIPADPENLPRETADNVASKELPVEETQRLAVCCGGSKSKQTQLAPEAKPASTIKEKSMKWQTLFTALLAIMVGCLLARDHIAKKQLDGLTDYYIAKEFSTEAMQGKTYLEVTPEMEQFGVDKFVPIAEKLPYASAETMKQLIRHQGINKVAEFWNPTDADDRAVVLLKGPGDATLQRSCLVHVYPTSVGVYADMKARPDHELDSYDFCFKKFYLATPDTVMSIFSFVATAPQMTHAQLAPFGDAIVMETYDDSRVIHLVAPYGAGDWFVPLTDADYRIVEAQVHKGDPISSPLSQTNYSWWNTVTEDAEKEQQTAAK